MEQESHYRGGNAQGHAERRNLAQHFLQPEARQDEHEAVARVAHTEGEKQHKEDGNEHGRVELVVFGPTVHIGQHLKHRNELVVFQLDWRIVIGFGLIDQIKDVFLFQHIVQGRLVFGGGKAFKDSDIVFGSLLARDVGQMQIEFRQSLVQLGLNHWFVPFQLGQTMFFLFHLRLQVGNLLLDGGIVAVGSRQFLQREIVVVRI